MAATDFEKEVIDALARLETHMEAIVGNGQPGILTKHEDRIADLEGYRQYTEGGKNRANKISIGAMLVSLGGVIAHYFKH